MLKNYLKVAIRNLVKQKYFSLVNIFGLAFGIAASVLIFLWISHEMSYDKFHEDYKNIYRLNSDASIGGQDFYLCYVPSPFGGKLAEICPEVEKATRISQYFDIVFRYNDIFYKEEDAIIADSNFFSMFSFNFIEGNPEKPFENINSVVLTKSLAKKYFGNEKAFGKVLEFEGQDPSTVSAVIDDMPSYSSMKFSMVFQIGNETNWGNFNRQAFILLKDDFSEANIKKAIRDIIDNNIITTLTGFFGMTVEQFHSSGNFINVDLQSLQSIHLNPTGYGELETSGNKTYVIFFSVIAILILFVAGINYMNLSTAYYDTRLTEVGIRKSNGATPAKLVWQFMTETVLISIAAFLVGFVLMKFFLPLFKNFLGIQINNGISSNWYFPVLMFLLVILLGIVSGIYPAVYLSRYKVVSVIRSRLNSPFKGLFNGRSSLVIFQFIITIVVVTCTILIQKQVKFLLNKDLGFEKEKLVVVDGANNLPRDKKDVFKNELKQNPLIENVCYSDVYPGEQYNNITNYKVEGYEPGNQFILKTIGADADYFNTYGMKMILGREFNETDNAGVIINQNAVKLMGLQDPLNNRILVNNNPVQVLGVVKNFHHDPLNINLDPILIRKRQNNNLNFATVRLSEGNIQEAISYMNEKWNEITGNKPFEYHFLDDKLRSAYNAEMKAGKIFSIFSILSVIIACMGILGIASFLIQRRIKEIGIRKANGARTDEVTIMILKDFAIWVIIAFFIACPIAWLALNKWLQNFAYKTSLSWWAFALAGILALIVALITVSWQSWQASSRNPVEALRYE